MCLYNNNNDLKMSYINILYYILFEINKHYLKN